MHPMNYSTPSRPLVRPPSRHVQYLQRLQKAHPKLYQILTRAASSQGASLGSPSNSPKSMQDSYVEEYLRFKSDPTVKEDYVNMYGFIRIGKILEDLDALAGSIAYLHCHENDHVTIVTASVDRIDLATSIPPTDDLKLSGHVTCMFICRN